MLFLAGWVFLTACGSGGDSGQAESTATLPAPQVRVGLLPTFTPEPEEVTPQPASTGTPPPAPQVQAWPTLDEGEYRMGLVEGLMNDIERRLNSTNTEIKP
jgi:hypothetical protein